MIMREKSVGRTAAIVALLFTLITVLLCVSSSTAYASLSDSPNISTSTVYNSKYGRNVTSATVGGITFQETLTLSPNSSGLYQISDYVYDASNYIYVYEDLTFSQSAVDNGDIVFNFYNTNFGLYITERYVNNARGQKAYAIQDRTQTESKFTNGNYLEYGNKSSGTPAFDITIKNGGFTSDGRYVDIVITYQYIYIERDRTTLGSDYDPYPCVLHFYEGEPLAQFSIESGQDRSAYEINIEFYYSDTGKLVDDANFVWELYDLDVSYTTDRSHQYTESIWFIDGVTNTVELSRSPETSLYAQRMTYTSGSGVSYSNLARVYPGQTNPYSSSLTSGFITEISGGSFTFLWTGRHCGTELNLTLASDATPVVASPTKAVNTSEAKLGETITYTVIQFVPYTTDDNAYTSLVFTDVLDDALDISSATVTVYRTDTLNGTARASDSSNWSITRNRTSNTVTATHRNPGNAGGTYEFIITVDVDEDADLTSYSTSTTSSGNTGYVVPNTASFKYNSTTKTSNRVTFLVPIATVQYRIVGTNNPSDSTVPSSVTSYAGVTYTIEDELTTSDTSVVWYFDGWYYDSTWTQPATGTITLPEGTTTLYGHWQISEITLSKTVSSTTLSNASAGDTIEYSFTIYNTGSTNLTDVTLYDELLGGEITLSRTDLEASMTGNTWIDYITVSVLYTLTQADIDSGSIYNTATVTAKNPGGSTVTDIDDATVTITQNPNIDLEKTASTTLVEDAVAGTTTVTYTFTITNTGNVTLNNITLSDDMLGGSITLNDTTLAPGKNTTVSQTYTLTQNDIDAGSIYNKATTTGKAPSPNSSTVTDTDDVTVEVEQLPDIDLAKTANTTLVEDAEANTSTITYTFVITNTGNVTLSNITLSDNKLGGSISLINTTLAPGENITVDKTYTLTQDDIDTGSVYNEAITTGKAPSPNSSTVTDTDNVTVEVEQLPDIDLEKTSNTTFVEGAEANTSTVTYTFTITNTGNVTLSNITLSDDMLGGGITLEDTTLAPGENTTVSQTYTLTQDDIDTGSVYNTATVTGDAPPSNGSTVTDTDDVTVEVEQLPDIDLAKTSTIETVADAEADVTAVMYKFVVTNTGNVTLNNFTLTDEKLGGDISDLLVSVTKLAPGESVTVFKSYTLTQDDIDTGSVYNTATVTGDAPPSNGSTVTDTDDVTVEVEQNPGIYLNKTAGAYTVSDAVAGATTVTYTFVIKNTGNVTLSNITLSDDMLGGSITLNDTTLAPGKSTTVDKTYTLTQDDIDAGSIYNEATVTGTPPSGSNVTATDYATVKIEWSPALEIVKTSTSGTTIQDATAGTVVTYEITVTNTGNVTLSNINVYDELDGVSIDTSNLMGTLSPSGSFTITATYTLTQDDVDRGYVYNNAFATSTTPDGTPVEEINDDETVELPSSPSIELVKTADVDIVESATAGISTITYMFTVTNTGNTTLSNIVLTDPLLGGEVELNETTLAPNASTFGTATYTVTQDDIDAGIVTNTATVTGDDPQGTSVSNDSTEETNIEQLPSIDLVKEVMGDTTISDAYVGDWVQFAVTVTNTGNTTLSNITITDLLEGATFVVEELNGVTFNDNSVVVDVMLPGDTVTIYVDYQLTQDDIDRGDTENIANVTATPPGDLEQVSDDDDAVIETPSAPSISLTKTANIENIEFALPGDVIYYTLTITNTGNTTINNLTLYDELLGGGITESLDKTTIVPGESATTLLSYTLTQDDIDAGSVYNFATATGEDPNGTTVEGEDDYTVELAASPSVTLTKTVAAANGVANEDLTTGDELTYTLVIANNGNQTITDISLYDELLGGEIDLSNATKGIDMTVIGYIPTTDDEITVDDDTDDTDASAVNDEDDAVLTDESVAGTEGDAATSDDGLSGSTRTYYTEHATVSEDDPATTLRPGEYLLVELTYTITQDDMNNGLVDNTATVTAVDPNGNGISDEDSATMYLPQHPGIELVKEAAQEELGTAEVGDLISYTLTITNTGDVPLTNITLVDELEGIIIDTGSLNGLTLDPGEATVVTAEYALTEVDLETGSVYNHAVVTAESTVPYNEANTWSGAQQVSADDDALVDGIVAVADDLILAQTGGEFLIICGGIFIGLITAAGIVTYGISHRKNTLTK